MPKRYDPSKMMMESFASVKKVYPKFDLSFKDLPEAREWKTNDEYTLELKVKMVGMRDDEYQSGSTFEILEIGVESDDGPGGSDNEDEE